MRTRTFSSLFLGGLLGVVAACSASTARTGTGSADNALEGADADADIVNVFLPDTAPQTPNACMPFQGDPGCANKADYFERCRAMGMELDGIGTEEGATSCMYYCCPPSPEPPLPPSATCTWLTVGDGTTCAGAELEDKAAALCSGTLRTVDFAMDCHFPTTPEGAPGPPGSTLVNAECCTTPAN